MEHHYADTSTLRMHFVTVPAEAPPLMLLHGIGMDWRVWQALSRRLHPAFSLYMLDLRGHGRSGKPPRGYTLAHYAADIEDLIEELQLSSVVLAGSSLGGMVAASVEAPADIVSHRILIDPPLTGGPIQDSKLFADILRLKHEPVSVLAEYLQRANPGAGSHLLNTMSEMWHEAFDGVIVEMLASPSDYFDIESALRALDTPTLLMRADPSMNAALSEESARRALALLPKGKEVVVPGAGHAIHAFKPREFVAILEDFVDGK